MPLIQRHCIETIRQRVNLVDVAGTYTQMRRAGSQYRGLSPFSDEKTPSFFVHPGKNVFMDYSSGESGDLFGFVQLKENLSFSEAVEFLAERFNIELKYEKSNVEPETLSLRKELFQLYTAATQFFHRHFKAEEHAFIRDYWVRERQFDLSLAKDFQIGYAPTNADLLQRHLRDKFSKKALEASGLFYGTHARFQGRLIIPIRDVQGRVIAFTARQTEKTPKGDPSAEAKYINSPETPIFTKGNILFGLDVARKAAGSTDTFLLVEGQLDCLRCYAEGIHHALAPQGTAITQEQVQLMRRYASKLHVLFDADPAGQKAALRMMPMALRADLEPLFLKLPTKADPDNWLQAHGNSGLAELEKKAAAPMEFAVKSLLPKLSEASAQERTHALEQIFPMLLACHSELARAQYLHELARHAHCTYNELQADFQSFRANAQRRRGAYASEAAAPSSSVSPNQAKFNSAEADLLWILLHHGELAELICRNLDEKWIDTGILEGDLLSRFLAEHENGTPEEEILKEILANEQERIHTHDLLFSGSSCEEPAEAAHECVQRLFFKFVKNQLNELGRKISFAENPKELQSLHSQRLELRELRQNPPSLIR